MSLISINQNPYSINLLEPYNRASGLLTIPEGSNTVLPHSEESKKKRKCPTFASHPFPRDKVPNMPPFPAPFVDPGTIPQNNKPTMNHVWTSEELEELYEITVEKIMTTRGWMVGSQDKLRDRSIPDCRYKLSQILRLGITTLQMFGDPYTPESSIFPMPAPFANNMASMPIMHPNFQHLQQVQQISPKLPIPTRPEMSEDHRLDAIKNTESMQSDQPNDTNSSDSELISNLEDSATSTFPEPKRRKIVNNWTDEETKALIRELIEGKPKNMGYNWKKLTKLLPDRTEKQIRTKLTALKRLEIFSVEDFEKYKDSLLYKKKAPKASRQLPLPSVSLLINAWSVAHEAPNSGPISENKNSVRPVTQIYDDFFNQLQPIIESDFESIPEI